MQPPPSASVVSVMAYIKTGNVATITRTLEDAGDTYHVVNHLVVATGAHVVTNTYFRREPDYE